MARVEGTAGRYASEQLSRAYRFGLLGLFAVCLVLAGLVGFSLSHKTWPAVFVLLACEAAACYVGNWLLAKAEKEMTSWKRGLDGEIIVGQRLEDELPAKFCVIHDLNTRFGNLDHIVIGPTGVFAVETKNWRGVVTSDGSGELLLNGKPTDKPHVRSFTRTIMNIRDRLVPLAQTDRFIQGVMVFPSAYEDTSWGSTGNVLCIGVDRIPGYFLKAREKKILTAQEVDDLARAFLALARMDEGFEADHPVVLP